MADCFRHELSRTPPILVTTERSHIPPKLAPNLAKRVRDLPQRVVLKRLKNRVKSTYPVGHPFPCNQTARIARCFEHHSSHPLPANQPSFILQPLIQRPRAEIQAVWPSQCTKLDEITRKKCRIVQRCRHLRPRLNKPRKIKYALRTIGKTQQQLILLFGFNRDQLNHCQLPESGSVAARPVHAANSAPALHDGRGTIA